MSQSQYQMSIKTNKNISEVVGKQLSYETEPLDHSLVQGPQRYLVFWICL